MLSAFVRGAVTGDLAAVRPRTGRRRDAAADVDRRRLSVIRRQDRDARLVRIDGAERSLTSYQFDLLVAFAENAGYLQNY